MADSYTSGNSWLLIYKQYDLENILHLLRDAIISPETLKITSATAANPSVITVANHGYRTGDLITIALCAGGTFTALNGTRRTVTRIDEDTFSVSIAATGTYTASSGTVTCTTLANYLYDTFPEAVLKMYLGINPANPPAATNYPAVIIRPDPSNINLNSYDSENQKRRFTLACCINETTVDTTIENVTDYPGQYEVEKFARIVCDYIKRYSLLNDFNKSFSLQNHGLVYMPEYQATINLDIDFIDSVQ